MSHPIGPLPLPTPQTLQDTVATPESRTTGSRWRAAAFLVDVAAWLIVLAAWASRPAFAAPTAVFVGSLATLVALAAVIRSWRTSARAWSIVWLVCALGLFIVAMAMN